MPNDATRRKIDELLAAARRAEDNLKHADALSLYKQAYLLDTTNLPVRECIAEVLAQTGEPERAIRTFRLIAGYYAAAGLHYKAIAVCHRILEIDSSHSETVSALARLYAMRDSDETQQPNASTPRAAGPTPIPIPVASAHPPTEQQAEQSADPYDDLPTPASEPIQAAAADPAFQSLFGGRAQDACGSVPLADAAVLKAAPKLPLFSDLPEEALASVLANIEALPVATDDVIVQEGEAATCMYVVVFGSFHVIRQSPRGDANVIDTIDDGTYFGEMSFLTGGPRVATVKAAIDGLILRLGYEHLRALASRFPAVIDRIHSSHIRRLASNLFEISPVFQAFSPDARAFLVRRCTMETAPPDTVLLQQGQDGRGLFLLLLGTCAVGHTVSDGCTEDFREMHAGDLFGEISMLLQRTCTATVRSTTPITYLHLPREAFEEFVTSVPESRRVLQHLTENRINRTRNLLGLLA